MKLSFDRLTNALVANFRNTLNKFIGEVEENFTETVRDVNQAKTDANAAVTKADEAKSQSNNTQAQVDALVVGSNTSPAEAVQARVGTDGQTFATLKQRLDNEHAGVTAQLAEKAKHVNNIAVNLEEYYQTGEANYTDAFARAFNYLKSVGGGKVILPSKEIEAIVKVPSYCGISGSGRKSIIKLPEGSNQACIQLADINTKFILLQDFSVNGNKAKQSTENAKGVYLESNKGYVGDSTFNDRDSRHVIRNLFVYDTFGTGFHLNTRGENQIENLQVVRSGADGIIFESFDNWVYGISVGESKRDGLIIYDANTRFVNVKSWNNGMNETTLTYGRGIVMNNCQGVMISGESQANLRDGIVMNGCKICSVNVNSELNGARNGLVVANTSAIVLENSDYNSINITTRNRRGTEEPQDYALKFVDNCSYNQIFVSGTSMKMGSMLDNGTTNKQRNSINILCDLSNYTLANYSNFNANVAGIGVTPNSQISPLWVVSNASENYQGTLIQRITENTNLDNTLITLEGKTQDGSGVSKLDIKSNIVNKQVIFNMNGNTARYTGSVKIDGGGWNTYRMILGNYHLWVDSIGKLRIKNGAPTSDTDGAIVGT
ncbi:hypothetical protein [Bacillus weihaiensis]|uniref:hypothetical protein n=1 Tax=Bacillus weihaiensis TaxID=1547283 RepID=UPI002355738C|nr:hypothetical protein [Bacillus weihaiensis]